jgi:NAD(P)-dependent dehydrogenase (short-subunit alcohol dehydrogenase family)
MGEGFADRVAVVTGGARGIGAEVIAALLEQGARAVSIDLGEPEQPLEQTRYIRADVTDRSALAQAFSSIDEHEKRLDVLVNNAGIQRVGRTEEYDPEAWRRVIDVHLFGMFHCTALAIPRLRRGGGGAIVSVSSAAGIVGLPGRGPYSAAKGAIRLPVSWPSWLRASRQRHPARSTVTPLVRRHRRRLDHADRDGDPAPHAPEESRAIAWPARRRTSLDEFIVDGSWSIQGCATCHPAGNDGFLDEVVHAIR